MSTLNTLIASQATNLPNAKSCADALEFYVTTPPSAAASASVWFAALRTAGGAGTTAETALNSVQLAAEDTASVIALTAGELSLAEHMKEVLFVAMRKGVAQNNLDCQAIFAEWRADTNFKA